MFLSLFLSLSLSLSTVTYDAIENEIQFTARMSVVDILLLLEKYRTYYIIYCIT